MALSEAKLSLMFQGPVFLEEPPAIEVLAEGWRVYLAGATVVGVPANLAALEPAIGAFSDGLVGMGDPGAGGAALIDAMVASWAVAVAAAPAVWPGAGIIGPGTPPPGLSGGLGGLQSTFDANTTQSASTSDASDAVAAGLHPLNLGGTAPSVGGPLPIL